MTRVCIPSGPLVAACVALRENFRSLLMANADGTLFDKFAWLDAVLSKDCTLDTSESMVILELVKRADNRTGQCWPGIGMIEKDTRVGQTKIKLALQELLDRGLLSRSRPGIDPSDPSDPRAPKDRLTTLYTLPLAPPTAGLTKSKTDAKRTGSLDDPGHDTTQGESPGDPGVGHDTTQGWVTRRLQTTTTTSPTTKTTTTTAKRSGRSSLGSEGITCPPDLLEQLVKGEHHKRLGAALGVEAERVRLSFVGFTAYWLDGKGRGKPSKGKEATVEAWVGKGCQWAIDQHKDGKLPELPPPAPLTGELGHLADLYTRAFKGRRAAAAAEHLEAIRKRDPRTADELSSNLERWRERERELAEQTEQRLAEGRERRRALAEAAGTTEPDTQAGDVKKLVGGLFSG